MLEQCFPCHQEGKPSLATRRVVFNIPFGNGIYYMAVCEGCFLGKGNSVLPRGATFECERNLHGTSAPESAASVVDS